MAVVAHSSMLALGERYVLSGFLSPPQTLARMYVLARLDIMMLRISAKSIVDFNVQCMY